MAVGYGADHSIDFTFPLNPKVIRSSRQTNYAEVPLALHDGSRDAEGVLSQWTGSRAQHIELEFLLHAVAFLDVEPEIRAVERLMEKTARTGEPPDMYFVTSNQSPIVRVESVDWNTIVFTPDLRRQVVEGRMSLRVMKAGGRK